jgi:hypothetical protein
MKRVQLFVVLAAVLVAILSGGCKNTYFHLTEEINDNATNRFTVKDAYYRMGKSIAITGGRFEITPGDSIVLFLEGHGKVTGVGESGVAGLDFGQTARFYIRLPLQLDLQKYDTKFKAICEITGSYGYGSGENLFVCQSGKVVVDSLKKDKVYGSFSGSYLNTSNKSLLVEGDFKAGHKK